MNITRLRLANQRIARARFEKPADVVRWLGAVQAQDYLGALWAVGLRMRSVTEEAVERALAERTIIRTWPMRGTLHFVPAADVRWMLALTTPRVLAASARRLQQQFDLDQAVFARSRKVLVRALQGGRQLTRDGICQALEAAHISTAAQRGLHILGWLAQEGLVCFGAREGRQQTFVLLDEWAPNTKSMARDEALAKLARRYFTSHGPATLQDFTWWSGLARAEALAGLEMARPRLARETAGGQIYWLASFAPAAGKTSPRACLLPAYDEYTVAYKDRSAVLDPAFAKQLEARSGLLSPVIVINGQVVGTWTRTLKKGAVTVAPRLFTTLKKTEQDALALATRRYGEFLGLPVAPA